MALSFQTFTDHHSLSLVFFFSKHKSLQRERTREEQNGGGESSFSISKLPQSPFVSSSKAIEYCTVPNNIALEIKGSSLKSTNIMLR